MSFTIRIIRNDDNNDIKEMKSILRVLLNAFSNISKSQVPRSRL